MSEGAKRPRARLDHHPVVDSWKREVGGLSSRNFAHRFAASENLVLRLEIYRKLQKHRGCVNTVSFNSDGGILISGSDDRRVMLWEWETGNIKLSFHSGHSNNVFQAKYMPFSDDRSIVTCAADGEVRHAKILERGKVETSLLGMHHGRAHKLAIEPGSPHIFYTCGEDGLVQRFDLRTGDATGRFTCQAVNHKRRFMEGVELNAIAIDPRNLNLFAVAGMDEYTRLYDIRQSNWDSSSSFGQAADYFCPPHLIGNEQVGITGLAFSDQSELLASYNDEHIYLFKSDMGLGPNPVPSSSASMSSDSTDMNTDNPKTEAVSARDSSEYAVLPQVYKGHRNCETVKGVNFFGPGCEYVVSGSDCGRIFVWRKKGGELIRVMDADKHVVNCIEPHPHITVLASSGLESDIKVWTPKATERATLPKNIDQVLLPSGFRVPWLSYVSFRDYEDYLFYDGFYGNGTNYGTDENEEDHEFIDDAEDDDIDDGDSYDDDDDDDDSDMDDDDDDDDDMDDDDDDYDDDGDTDDDDDDEDDMDDDDCNYESDDGYVEIEEDDGFIDDDKNYDNVGGGGGGGGGGGDGSEGNVDIVSDNYDDDDDIDANDDD